MVNVLESLSLRIGYAKRMLVAVTGQDPRAILARKLDFPRVIFKKFRARSAQVTKRGDLLGGGRFLDTQKKQVPPLSR